MSIHIERRDGALSLAAFNLDLGLSRDSSPARSVSQPSRAAGPAPSRSGSARASFAAPCAALLAGVANVACGASTDTTEVEALSSALTEGAEFVSVRKALTDEEVTASAVAGASAARRAPDVLGAPEASGDFYVAIKKSALAKRWFLTAYMKQFYPDFGEGGFASTLGTRVVSFATQNDQLYVFDASEQFDFSAVSDPAILVEAYPIVRRPEFARLPGASDYVLFDPARGLNDFGITSDVYADPYLTGNEPLEVGASFMQNFRVLADGAAFEQVFTGIDPSSSTAPALSVWGTLGVALRHYSVGDGYVPSETPEVPFYFQSPARAVPDSGGEIASNPVRWNIYRGMEPIEVIITAGALRAQADYPDVDVLGAFARGVESWNEAFGFEALRAVQVDDDRVPDDDDNVLLVDYPGSGTGFAFANWRDNPDNGEIRGGSVYFSGGFFSAVDTLQQEAVMPEVAIASIEPASTQPAPPRLAWGGMPEREPRCFYPVPGGRPTATETPAIDLASLSPAEKASRFIQHVIVHEVGHMLGLRHNFKGSLVPPSTSVMDYLDDFTDAVLTPTPQSYDVDAIRFLYGLSTEPPAQPFCTDDSVTVDPNCTLFDSQAEPLTEWWQPSYSEFAELIISLGFPADILDFLGLNSVLGYARDAGFVESSQRVAAIDIALLPAAVPIPPERLENPTAIQTTNAAAEHVLRRAVLDPPELRGFIGLDITDPAVVAFLADQAGRMLANEDGIRSAELRRTAVDVLKRLQADPALLALRSARDAIRARLDAASVPTSEVPVTEDLLARIELALTPYFD